MFWFEEGKYVVVEGNRRTSTLKHIVGKKKEYVEKNLKNAKDKDNNKLVKRFEDELKGIQNVEASAQILEVKPLLAKTEKQLKSDLLIIPSLTKFVLVKFCKYKFE